jgi:hypothetical protein
MTLQPLGENAQPVSFLVQINLEGDAEKEEAFWKAQVNLLREFAEQNGKPTWRATRVPQFGYYGNLWREFLKSIGYDALRGRL